MPQEFDEFGIPIKRKAEAEAQVDEFGIPIRKQTQTPTVQPKAAPQGGMLRDVMSLAGTPQRTQAEPQAVKPKQPTMMQSGKGKAQEEKAIPQPQTWQQATDVALVEQGKAPTPEALAEKANIQPQKSIVNVFKSQMQKQYETELNTLKRFEEANRLIASQYEANVVENMGMTPKEVETLSDRLYQSVKPLEMITAQIESFNAKFDAEMAKAEQETDPIRKQAIISRLKSEEKALQLAYDNVSQAAAPSVSALKDIESNDAYVQYKNAKAAEIEAKEGAAKLAFDPKYKDALQDVGEIDGLLNAVSRGLKRAEIADMLAAGTTPTEEDLRKIAKLNREQQAFAQSDAMLRFMDAKGFKESAKAFISNPFEITAQLVTESLVAQISHGITRAGAGAAMGAAIAAPTGVGIPVGAATGFAAGMGVAGYNIEVASSIIESLQEAGIDVNDEESLIAGFNDPEKMAEARRYANLRGVPIGIMDTFTAGVGSMVTKAPIKGATKKLAIEMGVEATGAGVGEATAQILSTGKLDGKEVFMEMIGEVGGGAPSIIANRTAAALDVISKKSKANAVSAEARTDAEVQVIEAMRESDLPSEQFNEIVDVHEAAGLIESDVAAEVKQQYEQVQQGKPTKTMQDDLEIGDTVEMSPTDTREQADTAVTEDAQTEVVEQAETTPVVEESEVAVIEPQPTQTAPETQPITATETIQQRRQREKAELEQQLQQQPDEKAEQEVAKGETEPVLGGVRTDRDEAEGQQESAEMRSEKEVAKTPALSNVEATAKALEKKDTISLMSFFSINGLKRFFHASPQKREGRLKKSTAQQFGTGVYFSTNKDLVTNEFGENVTEVALNLKNPVFTNTKQWNEVIDLAIKKANKGKPIDEDGNIIGEETDYYEIKPQFISDAAAEMGYDAIIDENSTQYDNEIIVLQDDRIIYEEDFSKVTAEAYHKAKADGSNPELVAAVEKLLGTEVEPSSVDKGRVSGEAKAPEAVSEQSYKAGNSTFIKRGDEYFQRVGRGKEKPSTKEAFERNMPKPKKAEPNKTIIEGLEVEPEKSLAKKAKEIAKMVLTHVSGLNMGSDQVQGTYLSTEKAGNRYERRGKGTKKATVQIKKPYVTNDTGNLTLRTRLLNEMSEMFQGRDFDFGEKPTGKLSIEDLSPSGMRKLAQVTTDYLQSLGYDSVYFPETNTQEGELIVFDKESVSFEEIPTQSFSYQRGAGTWIMRRYDTDEGVRFTRQLKSEGSPERDVDAATYMKERQAADARSRRSANAYENRQRKLEQIAALANYAPTTVRDAVLYLLATGRKLSPERIEKAFKNKDGAEARAWKKMLGAKQKSFKSDDNTIAEEVGGLFQGLTTDKERGSMANDQEVSNAIDDILNSYNSVEQMLDDLVGQIDEDANLDVDQVLEKQMQQYNERMQQEYEETMQMEEDVKIELIKQIETEFNEMSEQEKADFLEFFNNIDDARTETTEGQSKQADSGLENVDAKSEGRQVGQQEQQARDRIKAAEKAVKEAEKKLNDKRKDLRKRQGQESQLDMFGKPLKEGQVFSAEADVSEANFKKAIADAELDLDNAIDELVRAEKSLKDAIKADESQLSLFGQPSTTTPKSDRKAALDKARKDINDAYNNMGIDAFEQAKARAKADLAFLNLYIKYAKEDVAAGIKTLKEFAERMGEEINDIMRDAWQMVSDGKPMPDRYKEPNKADFEPKAEVKPEPKPEAEKTPPPPKEPKGEGEKKDGRKMRSVGKRLAQTLESLKNDDAFFYNPDKWAEVMKDVQSFVKNMFFDENGNVVSDQDAEVAIREIMDFINAVSVQDLKQYGGTFIAFLYQEAAGMALHINNMPLYKEVMAELAALTTEGGRVIGGVRSDVGNTAAAVEAYNIVLGSIKERLESASEKTKDITDAIQQIEALQEALKLKEGEIAELKKALDGSDKVAEVEKKAVAKGVKKQPAPKSEPTTEAGKIRARIKENRDKFRNKWGKRMGKDRFANLAEERTEYIKDLRNIVLDYIRLGFTSPKELMSEFLEMWNEYSSESVDSLWADIMGDPEFQVREQQAKLDWVAAKVKGAIERTIASGKTGNTNQDKVFNAIAQALVGQARKKNPPKGKKKTNTLEDAVEIIKNKDLGVAAAQQAMSLVKANLDTMRDAFGKPLSQDQKDQLLQLAEDMVSSMSAAELPTSVIRSEIRNGLRDLGTTMRELAVSHYSNQQKAATHIRETLADKLVGLGLDRDTANEYADAVEAEFMSKLGEAQAKKVQQIMNPSVRQARQTFAESLVKAFNVGGANAVDAVLGKRGLPQLTAQEKADLKNASSEADVKAIVEAKLQHAKIEKYLQEQTKRPKKGTFQQAIDFYNKMGKDSVAAMEKFLKGKGIELTAEQRNVIENGTQAEVESMLQEIVSVRETMQAFGRNADGSKRKRTQPKSQMQKMMELVEAGRVNDETTLNLFAEKFGLGTATQADIAWLQNKYEQMAFFKTGEIAARIAKEIENYIEMIKIRSGGKARAVAVEKTLMNLIVKSVLTAPSSMIGAITQGTFIGNMANIPAVMAASAARGNKGWKAASEIIKGKNKGVVTSDIWNTMNTGIPSLESRAMKEKFDLGGGDYFDWLTSEVDNMKVSLRNLHKYLPLRMITTLYKASRWTMAIDLIGTHPLGERFMAQMMWENAVLNDPEFSGVPPKEGSDAWNNLVERIQKEMQYDKNDEFNAIIDSEIQQAAAIGMKLYGDYRTRRLKSLAMEARDQAVVEFAQDHAREMQYMQDPKDGIVGGVVKALRNIKVAEKYGDKVPLSMLYPMILGAVAVRGTFFLLPRIMMVIARAIFYGSPVVGTYFSAKGYQQADTLGGKMRFGALLATNLASMAYLVGGLASLISTDDDDDENEVGDVIVFGKPLKIKLDPSVKFYGNNEADWKSEPLKINVNGKAYDQPAMAIQFGDNKPFTMRYMPQFIVNHIILSQILKSAKYKSVVTNDVTKETTVEIESIGAVDFGKAIGLGIFAGSMEIVWGSFDRMIKNIQAFNDKKASNYYKERAYTDMLYQTLQPFKNVINPPIGKEIGNTTWQMLTDEPLTDKKITKPREAITKGLGFGFMQIDQLTMDNPSYDEWGIDKPMVMTLPKSVNSWIAVGQDLIEGKLPENWDKEYSDYRESSLLTTYAMDRNVEIPKVFFRSNMMSPDLYGQKDYTMEQKQEIEKFVRLNQANLLIDQLKENGKEYNAYGDKEFVQIVKEIKSVATKIAISEIESQHDFMPDGDFKPAQFKLEELKKMNKKLEEQVKAKYK